MSRKKIALIATLTIIILMIAFLLISSVLKKSSENNSTSKQSSTQSIGNYQKTNLDPLPENNQEAILSEINNIDSEINSVGEIEIDDLAEIETELE